MKNLFKRFVVGVMLTCMYNSAFATDFLQFLPTTLYQPIQIFTTTTTYTIPATGVWRLSAMGPGGSGAADALSTASGATGGCGGGFSWGDYPLTAGTVLTITVPLGGAGVSSTGSTPAAGNAGVAPTTIAATGITTLSGGPGGGGNAGPSVSGCAPSVASGGTTGNYAGGTSGSVSNTVAAFRSASGGTAPGSPSGIGGNSGSTTNPGVLICMATGGSAVGGMASGALTSGSTSGGAGTGGPSAANSTVGGVNKLILAGQASADGFTRTGASTSAIALSFETLFDSWDSLTGGGSNGSTTTNGSAGTGAGTGGISATVSEVGANNFIGGTGAACTSSTGNATSGSVSFGGGSGGAVSTNLETATSGNGGNGIVTIERIK